MFPIERSSYYQHWVVEHAAIATHKWFLSEKAGHDVGWEYANWNWIMGGHRSQWIRAQESGKIVT